MAKKTYGRTASGAPITDDLVAKLAAKAEAGYDVGRLSAGCQAALFRGGDYTERPCALSSAG